MAPKGDANANSVPNHDKYENYDMTPSTEDVTQDSNEDTLQEHQKMQYHVEEVPPVYWCILLGFQHYVSMFVVTLTIPLLLAKPLCLDEDNVGKSHVIGTIYTASGIVTLLQTAFGVRLPIVQGGTYSLLAPTLAYFSLPQWECPNNFIQATELEKFNLTERMNMSYIIVGSDEHRDIWKSRFREIQGSLMIASLFEMLLGLTGAVGFMLRYIGPLSICPTVALLGLSLFRSAATYAAHQWWIALTTVVLMVLFSQYMGGIQIPVPGFSIKKRCHTKRYPLFKMFPIILSIGITWLISYILTVTGVFPNNKDEWGYGARTDLRADVINDAPWFRVPYPGQWGTPTVGAGAVVGMLAGLLASTVESVGDYHACAQLAHAPSPPTHAINRGIAMEGFGSILDAIFGTGNGCTSASINVALIGITKVASRVVIQVSALFMIVLGILNKFGALFVTIPDPVIGGSFFVLFGMLVAVGISNLHYVDLRSSRNIFIVGFAFLVGLAVPQWTSSHPESVNTGSQTVDNMFLVLLNTSMFVGGVVGFILDNTIPGTEEERGIAHWKKLREENDKAVGSGEAATRLAAVYDLPCCMKFLNRWRWTRYVPICPTFRRVQEGERAEEVQNADFSTHF